MPSTLELLHKYINLPNIAAQLDQEKLDEIAQKVLTGFDIDEESRSEWKERNKEAMKLAMQIWEEKKFPFEKASAIKYPLLSIAAIQFSSRAYPNIVQGSDVVKGKVVGNDMNGMKASRANRVQTHMNYQLLEEMEEWEENTDKLLTVIPILGCVFKKSWFDPLRRRNVSEYRSSEDVVINYWAKSMATVPRITEQFYLYPNELIERVRKELYLDMEYAQAHSTKSEKEGIDSNDEQRPHLMYECHTYLDLDDDGYAEPYIVTVHKDTQKVARIVARFTFENIDYDQQKDRVIRIEPDHYFTKYGFMPSPDGSIYDIGFGSLLMPINHTVNSTIDQLMDAGTLQNCQGGFLGKGINLGRGRGGGPLRLKINEWLPVPHTGDDLRKNIVPLPKSEPSLVLFQLLGFMVSAGEKLSSVTELLTGEQSVQNEPATTSLARIEQGLKVFTAIHKRLYRCFKEEYRKLYKLNSRYLEDQNYFTVTDDRKAVAREDYNPTTCDVIPVANPNEVADTQKLVKAQILYGLKGQGFNDKEINKRFIEAMAIQEPNLILENPEPPKPDPKTVMEIEKLNLEEKKLHFEIMKYADEQVKIHTEAIKNIALAEAAEAGPQIEIYKDQLKSLTEMFKAKEAAKQPAGGTTGGNKQGGV